MSLINEKLLLWCDQNLFQNPRCEPLESHKNKKLQSNYTLNAQGLRNYLTPPYATESGERHPQHPFKRLGINYSSSLQWRHNGRDGVSNHQPRDCLLNRLFIRRSKKSSKLCVTDLCAGDSPGTGEFPVQRASNADNVSIWWRHHVDRIF